jgi:hypothetical protein
MQNDIDTWYLESMFTRFRLAAHLVDRIDDTSIADELAKMVNEICHRLATLLGKPHDQPATEEPAGSQGAEESTKDDNSDELELANMVDELSDLVAQAEAFSRAAESLLGGIMAKGDHDNRQFVHLTRLVEMTSDAMLQADDVSHVLAVRFAQWRRGMTTRPDRR